MLGRRVVVYGGGNTAFDVARTAKRLGAEEAMIVYRRTREKMPAHDFEVQEALDEGILIKWLSTIKQSGLDGNGGAPFVPHLERLSRPGTKERQRDGERPRREGGVVGSRARLF